MVETTKARASRLAEGFFDKFCTGHGIDIGCGTDKITEEAEGWDNCWCGSGDANFMQGVPDEKYDYVYASHILEHLDDPKEALKNWWRILKHGGHLIVMVPHRDLYEKRDQPPSKWNVEHKFFFVPDGEHDRKTLSLKKLIDETLPAEKEWKILRVRDAGHTITDPNIHSDGEVSIEVVLKKL